MAALCHDIGHLPFSHAAEKELLPEGWNHEKLTVDIVRSKEMESIWERMTPPLRSMDIAKLAVGQKILRQETFSDWEAVLSEIIVGDAFGVDRIDYLLRDSHHVGVAYGFFDHFRLLDTLRILPTPRISKEPSLGIEVGGIQSAEALLLARYFMYTQVYLHHIRRMYDRHLTDFLKEWLPNGEFPTSIEELMAYTDVEVTNGIFLAARNKACPGHQVAKRILERKHFKMIYSRNPSDTEVCTEPGRAIHQGLSTQFGSDAVTHDDYLDEGGVFDFPVLDRDDRIVSSSALSSTLANIPGVTVDTVSIDPESFDAATNWLKCNRNRLLKSAAESMEDDG